ncbi:MAG: FCD domain-containing protein, partial [Klebsiella sp.]|nr:FCD domain-containing protein [Klebsiella sp.]
HQQIYDAIASRQVDAARAAMYLHLSNSRMRLRANKLRQKNARSLNRFHTPS